MRNFRAWMAGDETPLRRVLRRPLLMGSILLLASTFVGVIFAIRYLFFTVTEPRMSFSVETALWTVAGWWMWILLTPAVLFLAWRYPIERPVWGRRLLVHVGGWALVSLVDVALFSALLTLAREGKAGWNPGFLVVFRQTLIGSFAIDLLVYSVIAAVAHAYEYHRRFRERELRASQLQAQLAEARLQALEMQLHPHFLFNTLNAVSALMEEDVAASRRMITLLSELLRLTLDTASEQEVSVRQEIAFIERYLAIQYIRFRDTLEVSVEVDLGVLDARIPNLILQPIVENAIKHGRAPHGQMSRIGIRVWREGNELTVDITDNGKGLAGNGQGIDERRGIGIRNTQERLRQLYGEPYLLRFSEAEGGGLRVGIRIPYYTEVEKLEVIA